MTKVDTRFQKLQDLEKTFNAALTILHRVRSWLNIYEEDITDVQVKALRTTIYKVYVVLFIIPGKSEL